MTPAGETRPTSPYADEVLAELTPDELAAERDFLLTSLADLDAELAAGDIDSHDYVVLKDGYTARAAAVLRALDALAHAADAHADAAASPAAKPPRAGPIPRQRRRWRGPAVVASLLAFALAAGLLVAGNSGQRLPGQTLSGTDAAAASVAGQLQQAQTDLGNGRYLEAVKRFDAVIKQDPRNPEALAYRGWILHLTGNAAKDSSLINEAMASVQAAEAADPKYPDAHFFAGEILLRDRNDGAAAAAEFRQFLADNPPPAMIPEVQGELNAALAQAKASPATTAPAATAPPATTAPGR